MLREEQIDIRRQRAKEGKFQIQNLGRNRVFSDYQVTNPASGGQYKVSIRGFEVGDNSCSCPDYKSNTLGTCKHIEAVLETLHGEAPHVRQRKAAVTRPEIVLQYGEQLRLAIHLPARHSDSLSGLARRFFDAKGLWKNAGVYEDLISGIQSVPEPVTVFADAMEFMDREIERLAMEQRERELLGQIDQLSPLKHRLYEYQLRGAIFLACRGRSILGDDMGLGKTIQAMAAVELLVRERGVERVLVVAPASVKYQWESEIRKFTDRPVQIIEGGQDDRLAQYSQSAFYRLVNYEQVLRDRDALNAWNPDLIVLDEAQRIKNWESKISKAVKKLRSRYAIVLTGTPLENRLEELYSIVQFVDDRRLGPAFQFLHEHRVLDEEGRLKGYRHLDRIREKLAPILPRRTRAEVLRQLPERTDNTVYVELADEQRRPYEDQRAALARLLQKRIPTELDRKRILCCLANLRMLCDSTYLFDKSTNVSPKLDEFAELMRDLVQEGGHKAVVFSQWELMLNQAASRLRDQKIDHAILHGGVPAKDRRKLLERFRDDPACRVLLSTDAGGTGLNLQVADTVINLELPWNPAVLEQRIARVHRLGQNRPVRAIHLVTRGTIEERVLKALNLKKSVFAGVFDGESDAVSFEALGQSQFLQTVRELIGDVRATEHPAAAPDAGEKLFTAGVQFLETLAEVLSANNSKLSPELSRRAATAIRTILGEVESRQEHD